MGDTSRVPEMVFGNGFRARGNGMSGKKKKADKQEVLQPKKSSDLFTQTVMKGLVTGLSKKKQSSERDKS